MDPKVTLVSGGALWRALGFRNARAFERARTRGDMTLQLYPMADRARGVCARADDLEAFLTQGKVISADATAAEVPLAAAPRRGRSRLGSQRGAS